MGHLKKLAITTLIIAATWYYNQVSEIIPSYHNGQAGYSVKANFGEPYFVPKETNENSVKNIINANVSKGISTAISFLEKKIKEGIPIIKEKFSEKLSQINGKVHAEENSAEN